MTTINHPTENPFTDEQRRALAEVYRLLISLNDHESRDAKKPSSATDKYIEEIVEETPIKGKTEIPTNVAAMITHPQKDDPIVDQKDSHRIKSTKNVNNKTLPPSMHHPGVLLDI